MVYKPGGTVGVMLTEAQVGNTDEPTLRDLSEGLIAVYGTDYGIHSPTFISRFTDMTRQAAAYRKGRVLLAGDAAHVHSPVGGQGLNTGVQDAVNLGWKLAQVVKGISPESLLDTYHAERHPVGARVLRNTMAQVALRRVDDRTEALRDSVSELLGMDEPRRRFAAMMSGLDIHYDLGEGHPLLGRRMPDLDLVTADGPLRVFTLLHEARPVLLDLGEPGGFDITPWADRVQLVHARYDGPWELPALGAVAAPSAVLIRPDGYVAWVGRRLGAGADSPARARAGTGRAARRAAAAAVAWPRAPRCFGGRVPSSPPPPGGSSSCAVPELDVRRRWAKGSSVAASDWKHVGVRPSSGCRGLGEHVRLAWALLGALGDGDDLVRMRLGASHGGGATTLVHLSTRSDGPRVLLGSAPNRLAATQPRWLA